MAKPSNSRPSKNGAAEQNLLVLQGGGALGAYQAGVYEELAGNGHTPDWLAGISIGAINAALIAGSPPERRCEQLHAFWDRLSSRLQGKPTFPGEPARAMFNETSAAFTTAFGVPGFFQPRPVPIMAFPFGTAEALSIYETAPLRATLEELVDFDLINSGRTRLSVGAVNIRSGNFVYFDSKRQRIGPEHIMASSALPPGFPPVEIDGEHYWDGGLVSNTPLHFVLDNLPGSDTLIFQVDLFSAQGGMPRTLSEVAERDKDIRYSSRTRLNTDVSRQSLALRQAAQRLVAKLPANLQDDPDVRTLRDLSAKANKAAVTIVHLIHRRKNYHSQSKDFEFSRLSLAEHWESGRNDVRRTFRHKAWQKRTRSKTHVRVFDLTRDAED